MSQSHSPRQFHYESDGVIHGPVLARDLKALATAGKLLPTDTVWELETGRRFPAAAIGGLFPGVPIAPMGDTKPKAAVADSGRGGAKSPNVAVADSGSGGTKSPSVAASTIFDAAIVDEAKPAGVAKPPETARDTKHQGVFISYSSKEKTIADAICGALERERIRCWIAPRDIRPGKEYAESIIEAISGCRMMVVILSAASNASPHVLREVERAVSKGVPIVPFRVEDIRPSKSLEFFLSAPHWLDAFTQPLEGHIEKLAAVVHAILENNANAADSSSLGMVLPGYRRRWLRRSHLKWAGAAAAALAIAFILGLLILWSIPNPLERELAEFKRNLDLGHGSIVFLNQHATSRFPEWLRQAERGNPIGQLFVGRCYQEGLVVERDATAAIDWLKKSADNGNSFAQVALAYGYSDGVGVERDLSESLRWNMLAAEQGNSSAMRNIGHLYTQGFEGKPELEKAFDWFRKAAEAGNTAAMRKVGDCYRDGQGVAKSPEEAEKWYAKALDSGDIWLSGKKLGEYLAARFATYLDAKSSVSQKSQALSEIRAKLSDSASLGLSGMMAIFSASDFYVSMTGLEDLPATDPLRQVHDDIVTRLIEIYSAASDSEKAGNLAEFTRAVDIRLTRLHNDKKYAELAAIWEQCYQRIRYDQLRETEEWNSLVRQSRVFSVALIKQGKRKEAQDLVEATTKQCQVWLKQRPWDWYLKDAYTGVCFDVADAWFETGDVELMQPLLLQGWTIRLKQLGREDLLQRFSGNLPRKGQVPSGATTAEKEFFERFASDKSDNDKPTSNQTAASKTETKTANAKDEPKKRSTGMKRFTVPIEFAGKKYPYFVYVMSGPRGYAEVQDQFRWVEEMRGGKVPQDVRDSFRRLNEIAKENNVDFMELTVYALGTAEKDEKAKDTTEK